MRASVGAGGARVGLPAVVVLGGGDKLSSGKLRRGRAMGAELGSFSGSRGTNPRVDGGGGRPGGRSSA
jgi:hypothetical protein